jgi:hypothetical protein
MKKKKSKDMKKKLALKTLPRLKKAENILALLLNSKSKKVYKRGAKLLKTKKANTEQLLLHLDRVDYKKIPCKYLVPLLDVFNNEEVNVDKLIETISNRTNFWKVASKTKKHRKPGPTCLEEKDTN